MVSYGLQDYDKKLSLSKVHEALYLLDKIAEGLNEMMGGEGGICTGTAVMAPYPVDVVGREKPFLVKKENKKRQKKAQLGYKYKKSWGKKETQVD